VSDTPFRRYKRWVHEGGIATPLVVRWPDVVEPGSVSRQMGHVVDLLPTFLEAAGASYPSTYDGEDPMQGESLLPVLRGQEEPIHDTLFWEHEGNRAVRRGDWKLVESSRFSEEEWELYNMADDRTETNDLADERPERVAELEEAYQNWADRSNVIPWEKVEEIRSS
jgi:arylsulfatase